MTRILSDREEIRQWTQARAGNPILLETPDVRESRFLLQLTFGQHALNAERNEGPDTNPYGGWELVDWDDWFVQLEKQGLALRVNDDAPGTLSNDYEFVPRDGDEDEQTTDAARKPAVITVQSPNPGDSAS